MKLGYFLAVLLMAGAARGWKNERANAKTQYEKADYVSSLPRARETALLTRPLQLGDKAPDFRLQDQTGRFRSLSELRGKTVILSFYPQDNSYACAIQAQGMDQERPAFMALNAVVFSVSVQPLWSKRNFAEKLGIHIPLLADPDRKAAREYRVLNQDRLAGRVTFIIGPDGNILSTDQNVNPETHAKDVLHVLEGLNLRSFVQGTLKPPWQAQSLEARQTPGFSTVRPASNSLSLAVSPGSGVK